MLRNLFLVLFLFALGAPAMAMPMSGPMAGHTLEQKTAMDCHGVTTGNPDKHQGQGAPMHHLCIGCIAGQFAPYTPALVRLRPLAPARASLPILDGTSITPSIPPPRA